MLHVCCLKSRKFVFSGGIFITHLPLSFVEGGSNDYTTAKNIEFSARGIHLIVWNLPTENAGHAAEFWVSIFARACRLIGFEAPEGLTTASILSSVASIKVAIDQ
jgi:hypothetical protein